MNRTISFGLTQTLVCESKVNRNECCELIEKYDSLVRKQRFGWPLDLRVERKLGIGGQGTVFLAQPNGSDEFCLPVAVKIFSPEGFSKLGDYDAAMSRIRRVVSAVGIIRNKNLMNVSHFVVQDRIRMMVMEWIDGYDLRRLLTNKMYGVIKERVSKKRWRFLNDNLVTAGPVQPRLRAGAAMSIINDCLQALESLHLRGIVHGDVKPANIMLDQSGNAKIIDMGSAVDVRSSSFCYTAGCTPAYAAPQVLCGEMPSYISDLVSLGYVAIELLSGQPLFSDKAELPVLLNAKQNLDEMLPTILPEEIVDNEPLFEFCKSLVSGSPDILATGTPKPDAMISSRIRQHIDSNDLLLENEAGLDLWVEELLELQNFESP